MCFTAEHGVSGGGCSLMISLRVSEWCSKCFLVSNQVIHHKEKTYIAVLPSSDITLLFALSTPCSSVLDPDFRFCRQWTVMPEREKHDLKTL